MANIVQRAEAKSIDMVERAKGLVAQLSDFASGQIGDTSFSLGRIKQVVNLTMTGSLIVASEALPDGSWMVTPTGGAPRFASNADLLRAIEDETARLVTTQVGAGGGG